MFYFFWNSMKVDKEKGKLIKTSLLFRSFIISSASLHVIILDFNMKTYFIRIRDLLHTRNRSLMSFKVKLSFYVNSGAFPIMLMDFPTYVSRLSSWNFLISTNGLMRILLNPWPIQSTYLIDDVRFDLS